MNFKNKIPAFAIIILLILVFNYYSYINNGLEKRVAESPDENLAISFSKLIAENSTFMWHSDLNEKYNVSYFKPRNSIDIGNNNYIGPYIGFQMLLATARLIGIFKYLVPLMGCLGVLFLYLFVRNLFNEKIATISSILIGLNPSYVFFSNLYYGNIPAVTLSIISIYCLHKAIITDKIEYYIATGLFCFTGVFIRPTEIIVFASIFLTFILAKWKLNKKDGIKKITVFIIIFGILRLLWMISTRSFTAQNVDLNTGGGGIAYQFTYLLNHLGYYITSFVEYILGYPPLLFIFAIFGFTIIILSSEFTHKFFGYMLAILFLISFVMYGFRGETFGFEDLNIRSSMARYFLMNYAILSIFASVFLVKFFEKQEHAKIVPIFLLLIVLTSSNIIFTNQDNLIRTKNNLNVWADLNTEADNLIPYDGIIFTKSLDKVYMFDKSTAVYRTENETTTNPDLKYWFMPTNVKRDLLPLVEKIISDKKPVYVSNDATELLNELKINNKYKIFKVTKTLWKVEIN